VRTKKITNWACLLTVTLLTIRAANAGGVKYENEEGDYLKLGGRLQLQYLLTDPNNGETTDDFKARRIRPYIEGSVNENWKGRFQWGMGRGKISLQDVYMKYLGFDFAEIALGNTDFLFSREFLTSNKYQSFVERTFVGNDSYGSPHRQTGAHLRGKLANDKILWMGAAAVAAHDPDNKELKWQSAIQLDRGDDWSQGPMVGARLEYHPLGFVKWSQGDFKADSFKCAVGASTYYWANDDDNLTPVALGDDGSPDLGKQDLDDVFAFEVGSAIRAYGLSLDVQYNQFDANLVDAGVTDGLYLDSATTLQNLSAEAAFMILPKTLEVTGGWQWQDADNYSTAWTRTSVGFNYYVTQSHDIKLQTTYRIGENKDGKTGNDVNELFVQAQYVF